MHRHNPDSIPMRPSPFLHLIPAAAALGLLSLGGCAAPSGAPSTSLRDRLSGAGVGAAGSGAAGDRSGILGRARPGPGTPLLSVEGAVRLALVNNPSLR